MQGKKPVVLDLVFKKKQNHSHGYYTSTGLRARLSLPVRLQLGAALRLPITTTVGVGAADRAVLVVAVDRAAASN
jgi:hypothetical protein